MFGFEIMPAPFVVAHLQVGLTLRKLDAPLADSADERASIYLTNALTGWDKASQEPLAFPELKEERDRAERVKLKTPILVILGNPPYNGFAGVAVDEERELSQAYRLPKRIRSPKGVRQPGGQGLNDLYVRFFRMAERCITETERSWHSVFYHLQLLVARWTVVHGYAQALPWNIRHHSHRLSEVTNTRRARWRPMERPIPASFRAKAIP